MTPFATFCLRMGDNALILGQRTGEWCGHAPVLEEDIAFANMGLDLIGQTQLWYAMVGDELGQTPDQLAFFRGEREFLNCLLVEQPNTDFGHALMRQYLFDAWHLPMLEGLTQSTHASIADLAAKAVKEVRYHIDRSRDLIVRLGDRTAESHARMQGALDWLWPFTADLLARDAADDALVAEGVIPDGDTIQGCFARETTETFARATLTTPEGPRRTGGRTGNHSEHMGYLLAVMQSVPRAHPGARW